MRLLHPPLLWRVVLWEEIGWQLMEMRHCSAIDSCGKTLTPESFGFDFKKSRLSP